MMTSRRLNTLMAPSPLTKKKEIRRKRLTKKQFGGSWFTGLVGLVVMAMTSPALAASLFGVTGDGAFVSPETFFSVSITDASTTLIQGLGNGNDGESIAFNPTDGLMYHWSGYDDHSTQIMETINLNNGTITGIPQNLSSYDPVEVFGSTYDAGSGNFLVTDIEGNLSSVTPGGVWSTIGAIGNGDYRGIGFNGGNLYAADRFTSILDLINPLTAGTISSVGITLPGFTVNGTLSLTTNPDNGTLFAILRTQDNFDIGSRRLVTLNPVTGVAADIGALPRGFANIEFGPATGSPVVPEPSTLLLLGTGLAGLVGWRMKKAKA